MFCKMCDRLILPLFVVEGRSRRDMIRSMPGVARSSVDQLAIEIRSLVKVGVQAVLLFGVPSLSHKDDRGTFAASPESPVVKAVQMIKKRFPFLTVMTDICVCAYTDHGHCGILDRACGVGVYIDHGQTLEALVRMALVHADAGADWVAPSAMAGGQVAMIRQALDRSGHKKVKILGYSVKYASSFYGPFRDAASSAPTFGDRRGYQIDSLDTQRAMREIRDDIREGADMVMIKPALAYLDIIRRVKGRVTVPLVAYNVSGEYAMIKAGARAGYINERAVVREMMIAMLRAGADRIISYHAKDFLTWEKEDA